MCLELFFSEYKKDTSNTHFAISCSDSYIHQRNILNN